MTLKKLLLGSAAVFFTAGAAQAADFIVPVVEPVDYVTYCDTTAGQGVTFGTNLCIRITGQVQFTINFGNWFTDGTSDPGTDETPQSLASYWNFETAGTLGVRAAQETDYGWLEAFIQITATSNNDSTDRDVTMNQFWLRYGWLQAGYLASLYSAIASGGYVGGGSVDQLRVFFESGNNTWSLALEDPRDRARVTTPIENRATMSFPDIVAQLDGEAGIFEYRLAAGYGQRTADDGATSYGVYGVLGGLEIGYGAGELRLHGAVGWNGFDFVASNTGFLRSQNSGPGTYWAYSVAINHSWNSNWTSNVEWTQADGPSNSLVNYIDGGRRLRFSTTYQPLGNNRFQIQKQLDFVQNQDGDTYAGVPWEISGYLRFTRNFQ